VADRSPNEVRAEAPTPSGRTKLLGSILTMGRRYRRLKRILVGLLLALVMGYVALTLVLPAHIERMLGQMTGNTATIGRVQIGFPFRLVLVDVKLSQANPGASMSSRQIVISPRWLSWRKKMIWINRLNIDEPRIQFRRTQDGRLDLPLRPPTAPAPSPVGEASATPTASVTPTSWQTVIETIQVLGGTIEFVDERPAQPFRGALTGLSFVGGPVAIPPRSDQILLAVQGRLVGHQGHAAPMYCSGWLNLMAKDLAVSCRLEPLQLAAFEPYYQQGPVQVRAYDATIKATSHATAKANDLHGGVQLEIGNLSEADLSVLGATLVDIKQVAGEGESTLTGEIQIAGPLDYPTQWRFQLVPGNTIVQRLVKPLLDRGVEVIRIKVGKQMIQMGLTPATESAISSIETITKQVEEALEILAPPSPVPSLPATRSTGQAGVPTPEALTPPPSPSEEQPPASPAPSSPPPSQPPAEQPAEPAGAAPSPR